MPLAKNTKTGLVVRVPEHYLGHPVLGKNLVAVGEETLAAPKKEKKKASDKVVQEQPAPTVEPEVVEPEPIINEIEEQEDGN